MNETKPVKVYGKTIVGVWLCFDCNTSYFPRELRDLGAQLDWVEVELGYLHPRCPRCQGILVYDEEE